MHYLILFGVSFVVAFGLTWILRAPRRREQSEEHRRKMAEINIGIARAQAIKWMIDNGYYDSPRYFTGPKTIGGPAPEEEVRR